MSSSVSLAFRITSLLVRPGPGPALLRRRQVVSRRFSIVSAPSSSPRCRTGFGHGCARHDPLLDRRHRPRRHGLRVFGQVASGRSSCPILTQTSARAAPVPSPSARAISGATPRSRTPARPARRTGEHLVRRGALAVDEPVGEALRPSPQRLEREGDDRRRRGGQHRAGPAADERAHTDDDRHVHERDEDRERAEEHRWLITTSMSNSRYRSTDTPIASGINANDTITRFCAHEQCQGRFSRPTSSRATRTSFRSRATPRTRRP